MTTTDKLLPCPFCRGDALVCQGGINGRFITYGLVEHREGCFFLADGLPTKYQHIPQKLFAAWSGRYGGRAQKLVEPDPETDGATGRCSCGACGGAIDVQDRWCRWCGTELMGG